MNNDNKNDNKNDNLNSLPSSSLDLSSLDFYQVGKSNERWKEIHPLNIDTDVRPLYLQFVGRLNGC